MRHNQLLASLTRLKINSVSKLSKSDRVAFWKHSYARSSFIQANEFAKLLLRENPPFLSTLRSALTFAIVTSYARPFKQRAEVKLPRNLVPAEFQQLHDETIEMRDKIIAHRDVDGPMADWGFVSQVQILVEPTAMQVNTLSPIMENERADQMLPLFAALIKLMDEKIDPFFGHFRPPPAPGVYTLSLEENPAEWLQKVQLHR
jgi:hypothetical protein